MLIARFSRASSGLDARFFQELRVKDWLMSPPCLLCSQYGTIYLPYHAPSNMASDTPHATETTSLLPIPSGAATPSATGDKGSLHGRVSSSIRQFSNRVGSFITLHTGSIGIVGE